MNWIVDVWCNVDWSTALSNAEHITTISAVLIGGFWAYMRFFRGRIFHARLKPVVCGRVAVVDGQRYLVVSVTVDNVGSSKVDIDRDASGLRVYSPTLSPAANPPDAVGWMRIATFSVLDTHDWIESGEHIHDQMVITVPHGPSIFKLELRVVAKGIQWKSRAIVDIAA